MGPGGRGDFHRVLKNHGDTWKIPEKMVALWDKTLSRDFLPRCIKLLLKFHMGSISMPNVLK